MFRNSDELFLEPASSFLSLSLSSASCVDIPINRESSLAEFPSESVLFPGGSPGKENTRSEHTKQKTGKKRKRLEHNTMLFLHIH
jgi:hypothetical protein